MQLFTTTINNSTPHSRQTNVDASRKFFGFLSNFSQQQSTIRRHIHVKRMSTRPENFWAYTLLTCPYAGQGRHRRRQRQLQLNRKRTSTYWLTRPGTSSSRNHTRIWTTISQENDDAPATFRSLGWNSHTWRTHGYGRVVSPLGLNSTVLAIDTGNMTTSQTTLVVDAFAT